MNMRISTKWKTSRIISESISERKITDKNTVLYIFLYFFFLKRNPGTNIIYTNNVPQQMSVSLS